MAKTKKLFGFLTEENFPKHTKVYNQEMAQSEKDELLLDKNGFPYEEWDKLCFMSEVEFSDLVKKGKACVL